MRQLLRPVIVAGLTLCLAGSASGPAVPGADIEQLARIYSYCLAKAYGRPNQTIEAAKTHCAGDRDRILLAFPDELKDEVEQTLDEFESVDIKKRKKAKKPKADNPYPRQF